MRIGLNIFGLSGRFLGQGKRYGSRGLNMANRLSSIQKTRIDTVTVQRGRLSPKSQRGWDVGFAAGLRHHHKY